MTDAPTPLDLDAIRARADARRDYADERPESLHVPEDYAALADESAADVPALVEEVKRLRSESQRFYENRNLWQKRAEKAEAERDVARAEVARLTARPAPAWDEEAVAEAVRKDLEAAGILPWTNGGARIVRTVLAVVREHLPAKPDREAMAWAMQCTDYGKDCYFATEEDYDDAVEPYRRYADAVIDLLLGRSEADHA